MKRDLARTVVCIVGLGYVGLPLTVAFSKKLKVIGFDTDIAKVTQLLNQQSGHEDSTANPPMPTITHDEGLIAGTYPVATNLAITTNPKEISKADFIIICVPTPLTPSKEPDLSYIKSAAQTVGRNMKRGNVSEATFFLIRLLN